jgi:hypothetical protein
MVCVVESYLYANHVYVFMQKTERAMYSSYLWLGFLFMTKSIQILYTIHKEYPNCCGPLRSLYWFYKWES